MEINGSNITKKSHHDQIVWSSSSSSRTDLSQTASSSKSYTCSFCKKGFSNAQALGGHMNIHRKDRARLRQAFDDEVLLSLDITSSASNSVDHDHHHPQDSEDKSILMVEPREDHRKSEDIDRDRREEIQKLPFLVNAKLESPEPGEEEKIQFRSHGSPQNEILDLELRLGPEPHDKSAKTRREFF